MRHPLQARLAASLGPRVLVADDPNVVRPVGPEAMRRAVEILAQERAPWCAMGGGRRPPGGSRVRLSSGGLRGVLQFWPDDLVCRVAAGTTLAELDTSLARRGLRLSADAPLADRATLGGVFASGDRGLRGTAGGGLRERVLGLSAVTGDARVLKAGARVVKNVAGFDLARLHHGARGAFGMVLDFTLRVDARPEATAQVRMHCELPELVEKLQRVRQPAVELDPYAQVWLNAGAAAALAWPETPMLVSGVEGWRESVDAWRSRVDVAAVVDHLAPLRDLGFAQRERPLFSTRLTLAQLAARGARLESAFAEVGAEPWLICDCASGVTLVSCASSTTGAQLARASGLAGHDAGWSVERQPGPLSLDEIRPHQASAAATRLAKALDPWGLLPEVPAVWSGP